MARNFALLLGWVSTRALAVWLLHDRFGWVRGDIWYYALALRDLGDLGWSQTLVEYPVLGVLVLAVPWLLTAQSLELYPPVFVGLVLAIDAAYTIVLRRTSPRLAPVAIWIVAMPALGVVGYARFDLVPGVLIGLAVLAVAQRPWLAGVWAGLATAVKLWPALLLMLFAAPRPRPFALAVGATGLLTVAATLALGGPDRITSPLTWQSRRGLQIESVLATPAMLAWGAGNDRYDVAYGPFFAHEVNGPGVEVLRTLTGACTLLLAAGVVWLWWRAWRVGPRLDAATIGWCCLAAITAFMVSGKVLSPQYFLWLLPVCAAVAAVSHDRWRALTWWTGLLLLTAVLTQLIFPVTYTSLFIHLPNSLLATTLLAARNVLLVVLTVLAWRESFVRTAVAPAPAAVPEEVRR